MKLVARCAPKFIDSVGTLLMNDHRYGAILCTFHLLSSVQLKVILLQLKRLTDERRHSHCLRLFSVITRGSMTPDDCFQVVY